MNLDSPIKLKINDLSRSGSGVSRDETGRVFFVPMTAPGDLVSVSVTDVEKRYAEASLLEIYEKSPLRVEPRCQVFGVCGGCEWQHIPYELQWQTKVKGTEQALNRHGVELPKGRWDAFPAKKIWNYRNRVQLRVDGSEIGFYKRKSHEVIAIEACAIADPKINQLIADISNRLATKPCTAPSKVEIEVSESGEAKATWNQRHAAFGFRQVHSEQNEVLQQWIERTLPAGEKLYDLFGGVGNLSLPLVTKFVEIHCVDTADFALQSGVERPLNFHHHSARVLTWILKEAKRHKTSHSVKSACAIIDPPRMGLGPDHPAIAHALESLNVSHFVLVGCDLDAWARDIKRFLNRGWKLMSGATVDLFPHTHHVENLAHLTFDTQ